MLSKLYSVYFTGTTVFSRSRLSEVSMSLWIRLCNHTYIHIYHRHSIALHTGHGTDTRQQLSCHRSTYAHQRNHINQLLDVDTVSAPQNK